MASPYPNITHKRAPSRQGNSRRPQPIIQKIKTKKQENDHNRPNQEKQRFAQGFPHEIWPEGKKQEKLQSQQF